MKKTYKGIIQIGREFLPSREEANISDTLVPGAYTWDYNSMLKKGQFTEFKPTCDNILDLPSGEYKRITQEMKQFLNPEIKKKFKDTGFLYKRSALLHGLPGTGKTVLIQRIIKDVISSGGVVIFCTEPISIKQMYEVIDDLQPDAMTLVIFEEIDGIIDNYGDRSLLSILDGEIQKENVMYLATTNYIDKIPKRLLRPGRFSSVIEVHYPDTAARKFYFKSKLGEFTDLELWVKKTEGLSVDELKEVVQSVYIFGNELDAVVKRIVLTKDMGSELNTEDDNALFESDDITNSDDDYALREKLRSRNSR